jgi:hypothetical protein
MPCRRSWRRHIAGTGVWILPPASVLQRLRRLGSACLKQEPLTRRFVRFGSPFRQIRRLPRSHGLPCPEAHRCAQPLQSEAPSAQNAGKGPIWSVSAAMMHTIYGVQRPLLFPVPEMGLLDQGFGSRSGPYRACLGRGEDPVVPTGCVSYRIRNSQALDPMTVGIFMA